ncbi:hypothetical protein KSP40_PGU009785 [Platanthera guangdongensis]|uniref:NAD-dependent epimerase/dehydratase domain-containing protein n=1 Tax=Platanthera guangdongensis TaxID=2320717 RepID=A0ABR2LEY3_9ASPA
MEAFSYAHSWSPAAVPQVFRRSNHWIIRPTKANAAPVRSDSRGNRMFVFGLGFVGNYVSKQLKQEGWKRPNRSRVSGTASYLRVVACYRRAVPSKLTSSASHRPNCPLRCRHLYPIVARCYSYRRALLCLHEELRPLLSCGNLQWLGYLSSTSVYGDCGGNWVDEDSPINPKMESAKLRLAAEEGWLHLGRQLGFAVNVFRLGGIYGPGRSALDTITKNASLSEKQKKRWSRLYTSRIHVADIYQSINASFNVPNSGRIYNVVDDDPAPRAEVFSFARGLIERKLAGRIAQASAAADIDPVKEYSAGEKLVSNSRIKNELGVRLAFPSYRSGLESILSSFDLQ